MVNIVALQRVLAVFCWGSGIIRIRGTWVTGRKMARAMS